MVIGALGVIPFVGGLGNVFTFHQISKTNKATFVKHPVFGGIDLVEATGDDPIDITIEMMFFAPYTQSPSVAIPAVEALKAAKIPVPLFAGDAPVGRGPLTFFVVEQVGVKMTKWHGAGLAIASIDVKLLEYGNPFNLAGPLGALTNLATGVIGKII
jgi:hypothetical protein